MDENNTFVDRRRPLISMFMGLVAGQMTVNRESEIASHMMVAHLDEVGYRAGGWSSLYLEPESGFYWESHQFGQDYHGGATSLLPLSSDDARLLYKPTRSPKHQPSRVLHVRVIDDEGRPQPIIGKIVSTLRKDLPRLNEILDDNVDKSQILERLIKSSRHKTVKEPSKASEIAKHLLYMHLIDLKAVREDGNRRLYFNPMTQQHWEAEYIESGQAGKRLPSLIPITPTEVWELYHVKPTNKGKRVEISGDEIEEQWEQGKVPKTQETTVINHIRKWHLINEGFTRQGGLVHLYRDSINDWYYEIGRAGLVDAKKEMRKDRLARPLVEYGPPKMVRLSYVDVADLYGGSPFVPAKGRELG